ncbi:tRNA (adenosine(37)-N6)-dimethylallyltransferase MiaA [Jannaschia seohaensis]|uniref:tRNA dimethylallyltransferase n=1 Tax=Jannaschia seohaensis TaxID=475081 RepID=A0A2Y9C768_9RHOB|nr:tRNA (adenosine(37)-N6)-dimethylallyltransferase MiaA [Jannaschia seohaensis]PWJ20449.1 tRNA dimethylallyltransferase [Jannaschia seohaensis]SSA44543.1 tRNA dimethylallyltransferase [Jannaschia seohaensis]
MLDTLDIIDPERPVLIAGPTASGKSALALAIAEQQGGRIVNADALQVFGDWRVLTARPSEEEEARAPHALYGHVPWDRAYSVGDWLRDFAALPPGPRPIVVGGTGLIFRALAEGLVDIPPTPPEIRAEGAAQLAARGLPAMVAELDPDTRAGLDTQNPMRVMRAWEVARATGRSIRDWQAETPPPLLPLSACTPLVLEASKDWLSPRIEARFDLMLEAGALEEARAVLPRWDPALNAAQAIGAPQLIAHLRGEMSLDEARAAAITATRQYAKRQRTWFRARMRSWRRISAPGAE